MYRIIENSDHIAVNDSSGYECYRDSSMKGIEQYLRHLGIDICDCEIFSINTVRENVYYMLVDGELVEAE